jgi:glycosyltransferase involved in cell wall biosynthesis
VRFLLEKKISKSILQPLFKNPSLQKEYDYVFEYTGKNHKKIHDFVYQKCEGIIASDIDYVLPLKGNSKFLGLIPNPINSTELVFETPEIEDQISIFLGINQWNYHQKGITFFEQALAVINEKYGNKVKIIVAKNIPYTDYINLYNKAHILLDQCFAYDQGYNALEAMAKGKVVFTGAETEFEKQYALTVKVAINAKPDVDYLVKELSFLIENPKEILVIGKNARNFIEKEHDYLKIAKNYLEVWARTKME